jgi:hypothetical protein
MYEYTTWTEIATTIFSETCSISETRARVRRADVGPIRESWLLLFDRVSTTGDAPLIILSCKFMLLW